MQQSRDKKGPQMTFKQLWEELEVLKPTLKVKVKTFEQLKKEGIPLEEGLI
jgi:hypothetical protein